ncbi:flagellar export chaperone FliS [Virgibacillus sp. DJP39]|uniref:flagellar export chaperone FliS n=1 Tax=Virgibacillus sp. DJP39 TaxID=3409790 RepID=UPI003BB4995F
MSLNKQYQTYQDNAVNTASGPELTMMLYNGCIKFIKHAKKSMKEKNYEEKNVNIQKAQKIIQELMLTMDRDIDITHQILPLYEYMLHQLKEGNIKNDEALLDEALSYTIEFRDTWKEVILKTRQNQYAQGAKV